MYVRESEIAGAAILIIFLDILSTPVALLLSRKTLLTGWNALNSDLAFSTYV
jgi:hypothetical protein